MNDSEAQPCAAKASTSFFDQPGVEVECIPVGPGIPLGVKRVRHPDLSVAGAYGTWGQAFDNATLPAFIEDRLAYSFRDDERLNLAELGFVCRHHLPLLTPAEHIDLETRVGVRLLQEAMRACNWRPQDVDGVLLGMTAPITEDYTERIARAAGIPDHALTVSVHKACDGSVGSLNLALNPGLSQSLGLQRNVAEALRGKKVLVGGIEGLSRFMGTARDLQALQLFGNGAGVIGIVPGENMKFLAGGTKEAFDEEGVLQVHMSYPHSRQHGEGLSMIEVTQISPHRLRIAGMMHVPDDDSVPVRMAGPMGMVKLFVRNGVLAVRDVYALYRKRMAELGTPGRDITVAIAHHANFKINQIKAKHLEREGICLRMPWLLSEFGNVSAASNMIAFLRQLVALKAGDHVLFDGFGAGTYYDVVAVEMGR